MLAVARTQHTHTIFFSVIPLDATPRRTSSRKKVHNKIKTKSSRVNNSTQHQKRQQHQQENKCETTIKAKMGTSEKKRDRRRCRQQTKRRLQKIGDAPERAPLHLLFDYTLLCLFLVFVWILFFFFRCCCCRARPRVCRLTPQNRKQILRISYSHSYNDRINAFLVQRK